MKRIYIFALAFTIFTASCAPKTPNPNDQIFVAVQQTIAAIPTYTPYPPRPIATLVPLDGLFCEYQFCIGHPADMAFFDVSAQRNPTAPSTTSQGILAAYNANSLFIQMLWQNAPGTPNSQFMLDLILDNQVDSRNGNLDPLLVGGLTVLFVPITTTATPVLPYGGAAAWTCGGRAFAWKTYTSQPELAKNLLNEALQKFRCEN
ncbi:MAG: hypothetical protein HYX49_04325 [Chloroflexi bacterium]|nr:hypothetical protein [Chloroflexota bacterium]